MQAKVIPWQRQVRTFVNVDPKTRDVDAPIDPAKPTQNSFRKYIPAALFVGGGIGGGLLNLAVGKWLPSFSTAAQPIVNVTTDVLQSPGAPLKAQLTSPLQAFVYAQANKGTQDQPQAVFGQAIGPKLTEEYVAAYTTRGAVDAFVINGLTEFSSYMQSLEVVVKRAKARMVSGDIAGAARSLGAAFVDDWSTWGNISPDISPRMFEYLFGALRPHFSRFTPDVLAQLKSEIRIEALRLHEGKDDGLSKFCDTIMDGLITNTPPPRLRSPWSQHEMAIDGDIVGGKHTHAKEWVSDLLQNHFDEGVRALGWKDGLKLSRMRRKVVKAVAKDVESFEAQTGRTASHDELWRMFVHELNTDLGNKAETKAAFLSLGAYVGVGVGTGYAANMVMKHTPAWAASGVSNITYTLFGYLLFVGGFAISKFNAFGSALGFGSGKKISIVGKEVEREARNEALRPQTKDARADVIQSYFNQYRRMVQQQVVDIGRMTRAGDIDEAAKTLAGVALSNQYTNYEFHPFLKVVERVFVRLGPNLDGITDEQRKALMAKTEVELRAMGVTDEQLAGYYRPFIASLLTLNVQLKTA